MTTRKICSIPGCPHFVTTPNRSQCDDHLAQRQAQRGTTTQQGLGWDHQQRRAELLLDAIGTNCPDCGRLMVSASEMVADHTIPRSVNPNSKADRIHCRPCSDRQGGQLAHQ